MPQLPNEKLDSITDEVKELHPLLDLLLKKLPRVTDVEYCHGSNEMGADFVLARTHDVFETTEYVAIIAKVGKIAQDYSDVDRQIEECGVPRLFRNGRANITITEVWVITTKHITQGAQRKIHNKYPTRKIEFIDGARLEKLVDQYIPTAWSRLPLALGDYLHTLRTRTDEEDKTLSLLPVSVEGFYVKQDLHYIRDPEYMWKPKRRPPERASLEDIGNGRWTYIEGAMGSGKSKLIRRLVCDRAMPEAYRKHKLLPLVSSYNELVEKCDGELQMLIDNRVPAAVRSALGDGEYIIFIDGFDERQMEADETSEALGAIFTQATDESRIRVVVASRFIQALEGAGTLPQGVVRCELRPLTMQRTIEFISTLCSRLNVKARIVEDLKKSSLFKKLPRSPIAAILLARLLNENSQDIPSNMTELYAQYMEQALGRWDIDKGLQSQREYQALDQVMMAIAREMVDNQRLFISVTEAKAIFAGYLGVRNLGLDVDALFDRMVQRCETMVQDAASMTIGFKHRTFAEYFYAKSCDRKPLKMDARVFNMYWSNIFFFYLGLRKDTPVELRAILDISPLTELEVWMKIINLSNYLLAAYTTPYEVIVEGVRGAVVSAAELYQYISVEGSEGPFSQLPKMRVLYFLQGIVRQGYSFSFLERALEDAALQIDEDAALTSETKAYAIFFLNVAIIDLDPSKTFDFLLERHGDLPLEVKLALKHEGADMKPTTLWRKQFRHLRRMLKGNKSLKEYIDRLYEQPIGDAVARNKEKMEREKKVDSDR